MTIEINSTKIVKFLSIVAIVLIMIHIGILITYFIVDDSSKFDFVRMFDLDMERNIPTLFSSTILLISASLFYLLSVVEKRNHWFWLGLSIVFVFLAIDESVKIHENIGDYTEQFVDASGFLYYPWILSYALFVLILGVLYLRFFWKMERKIFLRFMLSAAIFLSGAIGFELLSANEASIHDTDTVLYSIYYTIEETLEMFGVIYLISILLGLLKEKSLLIK